jgi:hypothetical protein
MATPVTPLDVDAGDDPVRLARRAGVFALLARLLGPDGRPGADGWRDDLAVLRQVLADLGERDARRALARLRGGRRDATPARVLFDRGEVPPYEVSYLRPGMAGPTARLADVAAYSAAFGLRVPHERPDHVVAELELAAFLLLGEAAAIERDDPEGRRVYAEAMASFLRSHLAGWIDLLAARVETVEPTSPYGPVLRAAAAVVDAEAARRGVTVDRPERVDRPPLPGPTPPGAPDLADDEGEPPVCGGCTPVGLPGTGPVAEPRTIRIGPVSPGRRAGRDGGGPAA